MAYLNKQFKLNDTLSNQHLLLQEPESSYERIYLDLDLFYYHINKQIYIDYIHIYIYIYTTGDMLIRHAKPHICLYHFPFYPLFSPVSEVRWMMRPPNLKNLCSGSPGPMGFPCSKCVIQTVSPKQWQQHLFAYFLVPNVSPIPNLTTCTIGFYKFYSAWSNQLCQANSQACRKVY